MQDELSISPFIKTEHCISCIRFLTCFCVTSLDRNSKMKILSWFAHLPSWCPKPLKFCLEHTQKKIIWQVFQLFLSIYGSRLFAWTKNWDLVDSLFHSLPLGISGWSSSQFPETEVLNCLGSQCTLFLKESVGHLLCI